MKKLFAALTMLFCFVYSGKLISQNENYLDSLKNELSKATIDTIKAKILWKMCHLTALEDSSQALKYGEQALSISQKSKSDFHIARSIYEIGNVYLSYHDNLKAKLQFQKSLEIMKETGSQNQIAMISSVLGNANWRMGSLKTAIKHYTRSYEIYDETGNDDKKATCLISMGNCIKDMGEYDKALEKYHEAHNILKELKDTNGIASVTNNIGLIYWKTGKLSQAIEKFHAALELRELIKDTYGIASCYTNIGVIHYTQKNYTQSIEYWKKSLEIWVEMNYKPGLEEVYNNIGAVYAEIDNYDLSLKYLNKSLDVKIETGNRFGQSMALTNIGAIYMEKGELDLALVHHEKALKIAIEIDSKSCRASAYSNMGNVYSKEGDSKSAIKYYTLSFELAQEINEKQQLLDTYSSLSDIYEKDQDYKNAYKYYKLHTTIKDSLFDIEKTEKIAKLQTQYETEKKQLLIDNMEAQKQLDNKTIEAQLTRNKNLQIIILSAICGFIIVLIFSIITLRMFRQKNKANLKLFQQNEEIAAQRDEIESQRDIVVKQKNELEKLSIVASETDNAVVIIDNKGFFQWANKGFEKLYRLTLEKYKEKYGDNIHNASTSQEIKLLIQKCLDTGQSVSYNSSFAISGEKTIILQTTLTPILNENGSLNKLIAIDSDITALKETQDQLVESEKMAALGQLIAGVAHEVNTPLGAIRSSVNYIISTLQSTLNELPDFFSQLGEDRKQDFFLLMDIALQKDIKITSKEERKARQALRNDLENKGIAKAYDISDTLIDIGWYHFDDKLAGLFNDETCMELLKMVYKLSGLQRSAQNIDTASERAAKVVFALKTYARYDHSGEKQQSVLSEGIETVLTLYHNLLRQGVEVIRSFECTTSISCFPDELNQVWTNLVHNAIQAMGNKGKLSICVKEDGLGQLVTFSNDGPEIPQEFKDKIFNPFYTTKGEGSGLGLDIVRKIIEKHEGKIWFESNEVETSFFVWLPK